MKTDIVKWATISWLGALLFIVVLYVLHAPAQQDVTTTEEKPIVIFTSGLDSPFVSNPEAANLLNKLTELEEARQKMRVGAQKQNNNQNIQYRQNRGGNGAGRNGAGRRSSATTYYYWNSYTSNQGGHAGHGGGGGNRQAGGDMDKKQQLADATVRLYDKNFITNFYVKAASAPHLSPSPDNQLYRPIRLDDDQFWRDCAALALQISIAVQDPAVGEAEVDEIMDKFFPSLNFNGILIAYALGDAAGLGMGSFTLHHLGEYGESKCNGRYRDLVEIVSSTSIHEAPLHGAMWSSVQSYFAGEDDIDPDELHNFATQELCYYKNEPDMFNNWISCVHGVGHALGDWYGYEVDKGVDICVDAARDDGDFMYICSTGVFMTVLNNSDYPDFSDFLPCDQVYLPATCFRFKDKLYMQWISYEEVYLETLHLCDMQIDNYHSMGCSWGFGYVNAHTGMFETAQDTCGRFYPDLYLTPFSSEEEREFRFDMFTACLDAVWMTNAQGLQTRLSNNRTTIEATETYCTDTFSTFDESLTNLCLYYTRYVKEDANVWWNVDLLEKYVKEARFGENAPEPEMLHDQRVYQKTRQHSREKRQKKQRGQANRAQRLQYADYKVDIEDFELDI